MSSPEFKSRSLFTSLFVKLFFRRMKDDTKVYVLKGVVDFLLIFFLSFYPISFTNTIQMLLIGNYYTYTIQTHTTNEQTTKPWTSNYCNAFAFFL